MLTIKVYKVYKGTKLALQGYKEFTVHMSSFHGGLDMVMAMDAREEVRFVQI